MPDQDRAATREEMKEEALIRMDLLGLYKSSIQQFHTEGEIGLTVQSDMNTNLRTSHYIFETLDRDIQRFEEEYNCVVYHAIQYWGLTSWPSLLLFVSPAIREWKYERYCILKFKRACAYVTGSANDGIREITVKPQDGCLAWVG